MLGGAVPTRSARADLVAYAETLFPGGVVDQMTIARGAPDEAAWMTVARAALSQVANLSDGRAVMRDDRLRIDGAAPSALVRERIVSSIAKLPAPFVAVAQVEAPEGEIVQGAEDSGGGEEAAPITDRAVCADAFDALLEGEEILFIADRAVIEKESYPLLDRLALAARRCGTFSVVVIGVAGEGQEALARSRAQAVADYFVLENGSATRVDVSTVVDASAVNAAEGAGPMVRFRIQD
jgi:outer membrane protein OmpA-like peptidoglycan-associated protein